jgi:AraC-like DNA-binding protein
VPHHGLMVNSSIEGSSGASPTRSPLVERAQRHIWNNLHQPLRWRQVAAAIGCNSPRTLNNIFVRETGETIKEHVVRVRMLVAMSDIRAGIKIGAVALGVGYRSRANFIAAFRAAYGGTPRTFAPPSNERRPHAIPPHSNGSDDSVKGAQIEIIIRARQPVVVVKGKLADVDIVFGPASCLHGLAIGGFGVIGHQKGKPATIALPVNHCPQDARSNAVRVVSDAASEPLREAMFETAWALGKEPTIECAYEKLPGQPKLRRVVPA